MSASLAPPTKPLDLAMAVETITLGFSDLRENLATFLPRTK